MKVAVLWNNLTGYLNSCLRALADIPGTELFVAHQSSRPEALFAEAAFSWIAQRYCYPDQPDAAELVEALRRFKPDVLIVCGWQRPEYRFACRQMPESCLRVCTMDNYWHGTPRQWLGVLTARWFLHPLFDAAFVAGERQAVFARKLGFSVGQIWRGLYSCDLPAFAAVRQSHPQSGARRTFIYVGRFVEVKGIDVLAQSYRTYYERVKEPWPLIVVGAGPLGSLLKGLPGVVFHDFIQPELLPLMFAQAGCLLLPSRVEPWGVVIHEATAAGLPVICTDICGAAVHLVQDGYNGYLIPAENAPALTEAMMKFSELSDERRRQMEEGSAALSQQFSPRRWANCVYERASGMLPLKMKKPAALR